MKSARQLEISIARKTVEDIINGEMTKFLKGSGLIGLTEEVSVILPVPETFKLSVKLGKEQIEEERLVCIVL